MIADGIGWGHLDMPEGVEPSFPPATYLVDGQEVPAHWVNVDAPGDTPGRRLFASSFRNMPLEAQDLIVGHTCTRDPWYHV